MSVSKDLLSGSKIDKYIVVVLCEALVKSGTDLTLDTVGKCAPDEASDSGGIGTVQPALEGAALGLSLCLDSKLVLDLGGASYVWGLGIRH